MSYSQVIRACHTCDILFKPEMHDVLEGKGRFCSRTCNNLSRRAEREKLICPLCNKDFERIKSNPINKLGIYFCSRTCRDIGQRLESNTGFKLPHYKDGSGFYREIAFRHYPKRCNRCGYDRIEQVLQIHHIDRNRHNNYPVNLEVLCPTCHLEEHFLAGDGLFSKPHFCKKAKGDVLATIRHQHFKL